MDLVIRVKYLTMKNAERAENNFKLLKKYSVYFASHESARRKRVDSCDSNS